MQELGFRCQKQPLLHSFLISSKPHFLLRAYSMDSPFIMSSKFASFYTSAPSSPTSIILSQNPSPNICFYSVPSSPTRRISKPSSSFSSPNVDVVSATSDTTYGDKSSEFEFETSRRFNADELEISLGLDEEVRIDEIKMKCYRRHHESLPTLSFADDLFCEGKMMPLNPPPSQMYSSSSFSNNMPSPGNPNAKFKIPFTRRSLWNDDFDPFMVALETVKEEKRQGKHRRSRSMLPLKACTTFQEHEDMHENCLHSSPIIKMARPSGPEEEHNGPGKSPIRLREPKGVMFARSARMVKLGYNYEKPISPPGPVVLQVDVNERRRRKNKWQKMLSFTKKRGSDEKAEKDQSVEFAKSKLRKLSFKSKELVQQKKEIQVAKMTVIRYRPKLLLCMGYGAKLA